MALPYIFSANFEQGDSSEWDSDTDTGSKLDFPHYKTLAGIDGMEVPYTGAYCMRIQNSGTAEASVTEGDVDIADTVTRYCRFNFYIHTDFAATADDTIPLIEFQGTAAAVRKSMGIRYTNSTGALQWVVGDAAPDQASTDTIRTGVWYTVELEVTISTVGAGAINLYVTAEGDTPSTTAVASETGITSTGAVLQAVLGVHDPEATTTGTFLYDNFDFDNERLWPIERFTDNRLMWQNGHAFLGTGTVESFSFTSTTAAQEARLYDTDSAENYAGKLIGIVRNSAADETVDLTWVPVDFKSGCYVTIASTADPQVEVLDATAFVKVKRATRSMSRAGIRDLGRAA